MDLRRPLFHHRDYPHVRYENLLHPPDFIPPEYNHHLPPPPPPPEPHPPDIHLPPPPSPPVLPSHMAHPPFSPRFAFSPPHHSIFDRPHLYEIDPPRKPYFHHNLVPPPLPPPPPLSPPRENIPLRFMHGYPERNPIFRDEIFSQGYRDKYVHESPEIWDRDLRWDARDIHTRVPYIGDHDRYREIFHQSRDLYNRRDDDRRWDNGTNNWGRDLYNSRDHERRWDNGTNNWGRDLYNRRGDGGRWDNGTNNWVHDLHKDRDYHDRRWDDGINERGREMYYERDYDERRWDSVINERGLELYNDRRYEERSWDDGINDLGHEFYRERDCDERRWDYGSNDGIFLHLENRQREFVEDDFSLGRFNGRLGRGVTEGEFIRSKKKRRLQEKDALQRIPFGKDCSRHNGDYKCQHSLEESSRSSFRGKEKDRSDWFPTRSEDMGEREQSPLELAISFKSNSLIAKAILAPTRPDLKSDVSSTYVKDRIQNSMSGSSSSKSSEDVIKNDVLTSGLDLPSDSQGTSKELVDKAAVSGSGSVTADDASDLGVKDEPLKEANLQGPTDGRMHVNRLRKKRTWKQLLCEISPQMKNDRNDTSDADDRSSIPSAVPQLNSDTALLKGNLSSTITGVVPDTGLLPSLGGMVSDKGDISGDSDKMVLPTLKRKRTSSMTISASSYVADKITSECSGHADGYTYEDTDHACQLTTDEGAQHACETFLDNENAGQGDSLGINQRANNIDNFVHNRASELDAESGAIESIDQYARLRIDRAEDAIKHCFQDGLLEKSFVDEPSRFVINVQGHDIACLSRPQETSMPEAQEDQYFSEIHELNSSSESDCALLQKPENVIITDMGSADANSKGVFSNLVNTPRAEVTAEEFRSLGGPAVADSSNYSLGMSTSSNFLSADPKGIAAQFGISFLDALSKKSFADGASLSPNIDSVEGSSEAISHVKPYLSINYSPKIIRKRKAGGAQTGLRGSSTNMVSGTARSVSGEVARHFAKDFVPDVGVGFLGDKESCKEDRSLNEGPHGVEDSTIEVNYGTNGSFSVYKKRRKVVTPRSNLLSFLEDDTVQNGLTNYCAKLDQGSTRLAECGAEQIEDNAKTFACASAGIKKCSSTDVEDKISGKNLYGADLDDNLSDGNKLCMNVDLPPISHHLSLCADRSNVLAFNSGDDELLASGFNMQSCLSSPEELLSFSDFSMNTMSDETLVSGDPSTCSLGKSLDKIASDNSQTNAEVPPSLPEDINKAGEKLNLVHGKLALSKHKLAFAGPKFFSSRHPPNFSNSRKFHSAHVTKSRTWHRTGNNSVAVTEPKLQSSPLPKSHVTKTAGTTQNSYIRKGNSLVRKPSPAAVSLPEYHGSASSVYRLNACTDDLKSTQASNSKTHHAVGPTVPKVERVNTSEMPKAQSPNHGGKSLSCTGCSLGESVPGGNPTRSGSPLKTSDASEESMKSPGVPECQSDPVINSDSQSTLEEGNMRKKIMYVKRRSNQLVAASNSDDTSMLGVDKSQALVSDGYYKNKKNQLLRASPENHVKKEDVNVNPYWLVSHTIIPRLSTRRQSFAKTYRHLKFSSVWKLHDTQSSEKRKNLVGPQKVSPHLFPKKATYWRSSIHALGTKPKNSPFSAASQKFLLSRKRGAIYTRSIHGYSLRMSKVLSVGGSSLKWSKSIEKNSRKANEAATRAVAAAEKRKKEGKGAVSTASKNRNHVSRKSVLSVKLRPGERIFRIGSERYKMDSTRRTLYRITAEKEPSSSVALQSEKNVKRSYVPRRLLIGNEEYVRIGNGNQLVRDPKKRTRILASEKVRWSLRTARLRLARKRKYCQFFTRFGKCNKEDGKCPYIHDPSKIVVCSKFLNGSCSNPDCKLTHKVIPERMQDCSYFLKGSCANENCPYRHVNVDPDSTVCESFLRGYCADGNECRKKHTYVCPAFEATGSCPQAATCKLHHPKKKTEKKPSSEQKIVRGRYFDGGLIEDADCGMATTEKLYSKGKDDMVRHAGKFPDYISLDVSDDEEMDQTSVLEQVCDDFPPDAQTEPVDE